MYDGFMNTTPDEEIGRRIQAVRERQKLNQSQAVRALRGAGLVWSQGTLSKVESGIRPVRLAEVPAIARALGVNQAELLAPENPVMSALDRIRVVEVTAQEAYDDLRYRYLSAATTRRGIQLIAELSEGGQGPYSVSCSAARFLHDGLRDEYSETVLSPEEALACVGVDYIREEVRIDSREDFEAFRAQLPSDYQPALNWDSVEELRLAPVGSKYNSMTHLQDLATEVSMGRALEAKFPQVTFTPGEEDLYGYRFKETLVIDGLQEDEVA